MRKLSAVENSWYLMGRRAPVNAVRCYEVNGCLSDPQVHWALSTLIEMSPALRCRIRKSQLGRRAEFYEVDGPHTSVEKLPIHASRGERETILESLLNTRIDPHTQPLLRFLWIQSSADQNWIFLCFHHSICDALTNLNCMSGFLKLCDAYLAPPTDRHLAIERMAFEMAEFPSLCHGLPSPSLTQKLHRTIGYLGKKIKDEAKMKQFSWRVSRSIRRHSHRDLAPSELPRTKLCQYTLPAEFASNLRQAARSQSLTVNSVFTASLLKAMKECLFPKNQKKTLSCITFINMRGLLDPKVPLESIGCYVSAAISLHQVSKAYSLQSLAEDISAQLAHARRSEIFEQARYADLLARGLMKIGRHTVATLSVSNIGDVSEKFQLSHYQVGEIHLHSSLTSLGSVLSVGLTSTNQMLAFDLTYLERNISLREIQEVATLALRELEIFANSASGIENKSNKIHLGNSPLTGRAELHETVRLNSKEPSCI